MIHSNIWESRQFSLLSQPARLLYIGLISMADDDGRMKGDPALLRSEIFPRDEDIKTSDVSIWLKEIIKTGLVFKYSFGEEDFLIHPNWLKYQSLRSDRKKDSLLPAPPEDIVKKMWNGPAICEKKGRPYYQGQEMRFSKGKWWVLPKDGGEWLEFAGKDKDIEWKKNK